MLTRVWPDLPLALGLLDERLSCIVFAVIIIGESCSLFSPHLLLFSLPPCALAILAARWNILPHFHLPFCALTAGAAVVRWGNRKIHHLRLVPAPPEERKAPPLPVSPTVVGGDQRRGRVTS